MSLLIIEVHTDVVESRSGRTKADKVWEMHEQEAWLRFGDSPYPEKMKLSLPSKEPKPKAIYKLDPSKVVKVGNYGSLEIDDRKISSMMELHSQLPKKAEAS